MHHVIVTGGSRGIGRAITERLLRDGYAVTITARDEDRLAEAVKELSPLGQVSAEKLDISDRNAIQDFINQWKRPLYGLVNNAGIVLTERIDEQEGGSWDAVLNTNLNGVYFLTKGLLPHLQDKGRIINISSQLGKEGRAGYGAYSASKFGIIGLTKCWAKELGSRGITVNAICPGWVKTEMAIEDMKRLAAESGVTPEAYMRTISEPLELKRFTEPEEIANLAAFLISEEGGGISGRDWLLATVWNQQ